MKEEIMKRVVAAILTLFALVTIVFFLVRLMPGEPFTSAKLTAEVAANMEKYYGFDAVVCTVFPVYRKSAAR